MRSQKSSEGLAGRISIAAVMLAFAVAHPLAAQRGGGGSQCIAADSNSTYAINVLKNIIQSTKPGTDSLRDAIGLTGVDPAGLTVVTASNTCKSAAAAIDQLASVSNSGRKVYVIQAGRLRYAVVDPVSTAGEWGTLVILDSHFHLVRILLK